MAEKAFLSIFRKGKDSFYTWVLLVIVLVGLLVRVAPLGDWPWTHDELSALSRLEYDTFGDLLEFGIKPDGHPAGVQVFLYYWTGLFGTSAFAVKLPFLLMGLGSIVLVYRIGKRWFSPATGLFAAASLACLQFPVMYSLIARPYGSGLFLGLWMVDAWTGIVWEHRQNRGSWVSFVLAGALCCYNHHFGLLFAAMVGLTGLGMIERPHRRSYLLAGAAIIGLYLPHVPIFISQLSQGGLGWLAAPRSDFWQEHLAYAFHFHPAVYVVVSMIALLGLWFSRHQRPISRMQWVALGWFVFPMAMGLVYSWMVQPVLQHSMLLFSFPALLWWIFSGIRQVPRAFLVVGLGVMMSVQIWTLMGHRSHGQLFGHQRYQELAREIEEQRQEVSDVLIFTGDNPAYHDFVFGQMGVQVDHISVFDYALSPVQFREMLRDHPGDRVLLGHIPLAYIPLAMDEFPYLAAKTIGAGYSFHALDRRPEFGSAPSHTAIRWNLYDPHPHGFNPLPQPDSTANGFGLLDSGTEWGPGMEWPLDSLAQTHHDVLDITVAFDQSEPSELQLVTEIKRGDAILETRRTDLRNFWTPSNAEGFDLVSHSIRLTDVFKSPSELSGTMFKVYLWNVGGQHVKLGELQVAMRAGNPKIYGLGEDWR
ncbi:glycosyltransferase family 39 protein [Pontibacter sp. G13]|uniref:glycosyltransferase family 39 protein n=1 Tax=Pontibacter sp. G13 TaxID=3074898 RepID=UPI00288A6E93|nr:glycosyltransferase family 39 protein [Pontibacter sp. G13]WNJ20054.1 glycosyltransferase family 39 protein [Pontibacter sp. G13]